jgi:hypothetical protein
LKKQGFGWKRQGRIVQLIAWCCWWGLKAIALISTNLTRRTVTQEEARQFAKENNFEDYFETSAKDNSNVQTLFVETGKNIFARYEKKMTVQQNETVSLQKTDVKEKKGCCGKWKINKKI